MVGRQRNISTSDEATLNLAFILMHNIKGIVFGNKRNVKLMLLPKEVSLKSENNQCCSGNSYD